MNLRKLKSYEEIKILIEELALADKTDALLTTYKGREHELVQHLTKLSKGKKGEEAATAATIAEIRILLNELAVTNADEMLASYKGRESLLLEHIKKAKSRI